MSQSLCVKTDITYTQAKTENASYWTVTCEESHLVTLWYACNFSSTGYECLNYLLTYFLMIIATGCMAELILHCVEKKRDQNVFCNISYKTRAILVKVATQFPE